MILFVLFIHACESMEDETLYTADEFIDVGIRLTGGKRDTLIADLIAVENKLDNGGYVSEFISVTYIFSFNLDQRYRYVSFSYSTETKSKIQKIA